MASIKKDILLKVGLVYLGVTLFALLIVFKIIYLQFIGDDEWKQAAAETRIKNFRIPPHRGDIYAADMRLLASSVPFYEIRMDMKTPALTDEVFYGKLDSLSLCLSRLFRDKSKAEYKKQLTNARRVGNRYYLIQRRVNYVQLKQLKEFPIFRRGQYKGGLIVNQDNIRTKPHQNLASRTIGKTTRSVSGNVVGIEGAFDKYLGGVEGIKKMQKLAGNIWMPLDGANEIEPKDGSSVVTTIDVNLQDVAEKALLKHLEKNKAHAGTAVLMEVKTGEIKAIVNLTDTFGTYREYYNYAVGHSSEPGSTFKLPVMVAAMEDGYIKASDSVETGDGVLEYYDLMVRDDNYMRGGNGTITAQRAFELSSNVGMAKIITDAYAKHEHRFVDRLYSMNLNEPLGISIRGEGDPVIHYPGDKLWSGVTLASMSYGYAVKVTPLQLLAFYNAIANDGRMVRPRFVREIRNHGKLERNFVTEEINHSVCSRSTLRMARAMLEGVVQDGTARALKKCPVSIAGKTGTTQIYSRTTGYGKRSYQASFAGYFPTNKPKYSCIVVVYNPTNYQYHGAEVAAPVFAEIAEKLYATDIDMQTPLNAREPEHLELPYSKNGYQPEIADVLEELQLKLNTDDKHSDWVSTQKADDHVALHTTSVNQNLVPNVVSMGLKDALYLLENIGLRVEVDGRGSIRRQSIPAGTRVRKGDVIKLEMSFTEG